MDRRQLRFVLGALLTGLMLSALDSTIVSTALPTIVGELGGLNHISWVFTAYLLSSTVSLPLFGKISDIYGRKRMFQVTILVFLLGSVLAGLSQNLLQLIVCRGIQGVGGGGVLALAFTILGDIISPRERGKYMGYFTGVFAAASVIGPLVGGFCVDHLTWRWVFYLNLPLGGVALLVTAVYLQVPKPSERRPIDFAGSGLLAAGVISLLLASTWGGQQYAWTSAVIVGLGLGGVALCVLFVMHERHTAEPILPLRLFRDPVFRVAITMAALFGSVMVGASVFLPLFLQVVTGVSATSSGFLLVPMMTGILVGSSVTGRIVTRSGRYKRYPIIGSLITFAGIWLFALLSLDSSRAQVSIGLALLGLGVGTATPMLTLVVQNAAPAGDMGISTSSVNFFRSLGSAFGIAIFGAIMNARLDSVLAAKLPSSVKLGNDILSSPAQIRALPSAVHSAVSAAVAAGVSFAFLCSLPVVAVTFVLAWLLREVPLRETLGPAVFVEGMEEGLVFSPEAGPTTPPVTPAPTTGT